MLPDYLRWYCYPHSYLIGIDPTTINQIERDLLMPTLTPKRGRRDVTYTNEGFNTRIETVPGYAAILDLDEVAKLSSELFRMSFFASNPREAMDGDRKSIVAGSGSSRAAVYVPDTEAQAERNLNFAIANLKAYVDWVETGRKEAEEKAEKLRKEKEEAAEKARLEKERRERVLREEIERQRKAQEERKGALKLYNASTGRNDAYWREPQHVIDRWIELYRTAQRVPRTPKVDPFGLYSTSAGNVITTNAVNTGRLFNF